MTTIIDRLLQDYDRGRLGRRQLIAALASLAAAPAAAPAEDSTFRATGLAHIAIRVTDIPRSRDFYRKHFGAPVLTEAANNCFLGLGKQDFLTLFKGQKGELDHYCIAIENYRAEAAVEELKRQGLNPRRSAGTNRVYFPDPDGITVQVSAPDNRP